MKTQISYSYLETLGDVIEDRPVLTFRAEDALLDVLHRMKETNQNAGAVVDKEGRLIGMITEGNIMRCVAPPLKRQSMHIDDLCRFKSIENLIALDVIISEPDMLHMDDRIEDAMDIMEYLGHTYMPVTDSRKKPVGIVSFEELKHILEKKYGALKSLDDPISLYMIRQKLNDLNLGYANTF